MCIEENKGADNVSHSLKTTENFNITLNVLSLHRVDGLDKHCITEQHSCFQYSIQL